MRKLVLLIISLVLCACTLQQGPAKFHLDEELINTEQGTVLTISSLELDYISRVTDCLSYEVFNEYVKSNKEWKEAKKEQRLVTVNDEYTASVVRYSLEDTKRYYVFKIKEIEDGNVMYEVEIPDKTNLLCDFFEEEEEVINITLPEEDYHLIHGYYISNKEEEVRAPLTLTHNQAIEMFDQMSEEELAKELPFGYATIETVGTPDISEFYLYFIYVDNGIASKIYVWRYNDETYTSIIDDQRIPAVNACLSITDSPEGNFMCRSNNDLRYEYYQIIDSTQLNDLLEDTKEYGDYLFDEYASPDLWKDTTKEYRLVSVNGEYTTSIARYSAMHSYGRAYKYFFLGSKEEDGKRVMYEITNTNQDYVTDTVASFFEREEEIVEFELDDEKYDIVNGFYIPKIMEGESFLVAPYNQIVRSYRSAAENNSMTTMPFKYVDIEPLYYYKDGTLAYIYIHTDYGTHTMTYHYEVNQTPFHSGVYDEVLPEDGACQTGSGYDFTYTLCREGNTLYHTTK